MKVHSTVSKSLSKDNSTMTLQNQEIGDQFSLGHRLQRVQSMKVFNVPKIKSQMARSRSLGLLGKSTTRSKNAVLPTQDLWRGIHFTKDVKPSMSEEEHQLRVINRENTPFVTSTNALGVRFAPVRDKFVEKYEPLIKEHRRRD